MKKLLLLFSAIMVMNTLFAQDLIVTTDAKKIEAKIIEVSRESIKYLEFGNQDGPTFIMSTDEISSIIYSNGQVKVYQSAPQQSSIVAENETYKPETLSMISRSGNSYYYEGRKMRGSTYARFLEQNCPAAYDQYHNGDMIAAVGWGLLAGGLLVDVGFSWWAPYTGYVALAAEIACIPTLCVGYAKKHHSADTFNSMCANKSKPQAYWSINTSQNGIGLALNF